VRASSAAAAVATPARRQVKLARAHRTDSREVDVRVDGSEYGAQRYEHYENDRPDEHVARRDFIRPTCWQLSRDVRQCNRQSMSNCSP